MATNLDLSIIAQSLFEHMLQSLRFLMSKQHIGKRLQAAAERTGSCAGRGTVAAVDASTYQEPFVHRALLIRTHGQIQGYHLWVKKPLSQRLPEANAEGAQQEVLLPSPCSCTLPSQLLLVISGNQTVDQVKLLSPSVWSVLSAELQRHHLVYKCSAKKHHWYNAGGISGPAA